MINCFDGKFAFLSNFFPSPIKSEGIVYPTVEHFFQAQKANTLSEKMAIAAAETPGRAKRLGRLVSLRPDWEEVKVDVMRNGLELKFSEPKLRMKLLSTGDAPLIEGNTWHDNTWGDCKCERCKNKIGHNILGKLLMSIREGLKDNERICSQ